MIQRIVITLLLSYGLLPGFDLTFKTYDDFLGKYVCNQGVAYAKVVKDNVTDAVDKELASLTKVEFDKLKEKDKVAYLINVYNFYTILLIKQNYPVNSIRKIKKPWDTPIVPLFGKKVTLNHIEHEILRKQFKEPRIHFALVCASIGCPEIFSEAYIGQKLNMQLDKAAKKFLTDRKKNRIESKTLYLSKIFEWYGDDFKEKYGGYKEYIIQLLKLSGDYKIKFIDYDWNLNDVSGCGGK